MTAAAKPRKPAFFWQGVLIMLPAILLALISLITLHRDEQAAETETRKRAADAVQNLGQNLRLSLDSELQRFVALKNDWTDDLHTANQAAGTRPFPNAKLQTEIEKWERDFPGLKFADQPLPQGTLLADGRQVEPPDFPAAPQPPPWFRELTPSQKQAWEALSQACGSHNSQAIDTRRQEFWDQHPSPEAIRAAELLIQPPEQISQNTGAFPSETGLAFEEIAVYQQLTRTNTPLTATLLQAVWYRVLEHSSLISPKLLGLAGERTSQTTPALQLQWARIQTEFDQQTQLRRYLESLRHRPDLQPWKSLWWSHWTDDGTQLAIFHPVTLDAYRNSIEQSFTGPGYYVILVPHAVVDALFQRALAAQAFLIPAYATPALTVEGAVISRPPPAVATNTTALLGSTEQAAGNMYAQNAIRFEVKFFLTNRAALLAAGQHRTRLFGTIILAAMLTSLIGLLAARRAFYRQLELNELKTNFVSSVSHELRAPIASVRLMAENLATGKISGPTRQGEYFRFIVQECRRLSSLIENVLDFSRIEQGRKQYEFEPTNPVALAETTVKLLEPYAAEKGVVLRLVVPSTPPSQEWILDGRALQQALINLIDNAVKHSPVNGGVTVELTSDATALCLSVVDQGPGIPSAEHEKIFERFYRRGSELRRETQGIGIGLSVVKHIVTAHGGHVRVQSVVGQGSRFTIELPARKNIVPPDHS